ncbi:tetratricopeptide repeat protein [Streptomyces jumonjinensis]|uniref:Transcriptional regulator n=1 Tax=Streptomyces jumonjinensis TaxID=1945 RepID=A0A646KP93_STRJU|nr:transcriptional regulator [Streptomyces jumonjinensis]MQT04102.1 transcriptional regulator [Streptomyces jumonjinensis]
MPRTNKTPNDLLSHWMARSGISNAELARAVTRRARTAGLRGVCPSEGRVRAWRQGETPRHPVPQLIADHLRHTLGIHLTCADIAMPGTVAAPAGPDLPWEPRSTIAVVDHLTRSELMDPHTRHTNDAHTLHTGSELLTPLQQWAVATPSTLAKRGAGRIGMSDVAAIRELTGMFRDADNRHGGILSRKAVIAQMQDANTLLNTATYTETTGRALFAAVADLGSVAAWMAFDSGQHRTAQKIFIIALHAAGEAGDKVLGAHILQCMARQMSHLNHYDDALDLVALAQYGARRQATWATRSMLTALDARFQAIVGQLDASERAAGQAEEHFARATLANEPPHMAFFDEAELSATLGVAHQIAAKHDTAISRTRRAERSLQLLGRALELRPAHRVRSTAFDHLGIARTHLAVGELAGAYQETRRALDLFATIGSTRVSDRLGELHDEAAPYASSQQAAALREEIKEAVTAAA